MYLHAFSAARARAITFRSQRQITTAPGSSFTVFSLPFTALSLPFRRLSPRFCCRFEECDLEHPALQIAHYSTVAITKAPRDGGAEGGGTDCTPEPLDLSQATATASSHAWDEVAAAAIDGDETTSWYSGCDPTGSGPMPCTGERDPAVENSAWFSVDLEYAACIGSVDWMFYDNDWAPTEVLLQSSLDGASWVDVEHVSVDFDTLQPQTDYDGAGPFSEPRWIYGSTFTSRRARFIRLVYLGDVQNIPRSPYWHSIRELFVMTGCCDSSEMTFHRQYETAVCDWDEFDDRSAEVTAQCCPTTESCDASDGMPRSCDLSCALEFVPFVRECHALLEEVGTPAIRCESRNSALSSLLLPTSNSIAGLRSWRRRSLASIRSPPAACEARCQSFGLKPTI